MICGKGYLQRCQVDSHGEASHLGRRSCRPDRGVVMFDANPIEVFDILLGFYTTALADSRKPGKFESFQSPKRNI